MRRSLQYKRTDDPIDDDANDTIHVVNAQGHADEEAQLLRTEELEFEDNELLARGLQTRPRPRGLWGFLCGPEPPRVQAIRPYFPALQRSPIKLLEARRLNKPISLIIVLLLWFLIFTWFLAAQLPIRNDDNDSVLNLDCVDTLWRRKNECGVNGIDCRPFSNQSFAFRCPAKCSDVKLLNPHFVGPLEVNYRPLVIGTGQYRGDSFICGSAIHAGILNDRKGGCGRVSLLGDHDNFASTKHHGIESIAFDSYFPLSFAIAFDDSFRCSSDPRSALLPVSLLFTAALAIFTTSPKIFFPIFVLIFAHVSFASDPPSASYRNITVLPDHLSMFAKRLLPALFVALVVYSTTVKRTLSGLTAQFDKALFWLGGFWIGALSNYTFDWIPLSRLTAHDLKQQPGAELALAIIILILVVIIAGQVYHFRLEGRLLRYLGLYGLFIFGIIVCLVIPGVNLRIHHYILALLLLPGTSLQTRPSLLYQGILLGLFVNGIARWDFDSILQTSDAIRADARLDSVIPKLLVPTININDGGLVVAFKYGAHPTGVDGISVLVNDVERDRAFYDDGLDGAWSNFEWTRPVDTTGPNEYFRWAYHAVFLTAAALAPSLVPRQELSGKMCPAIPVCPRWDACVATATNGARFQMKCLTDFNGQVIESAQATHFVDCADACSHYPGCLAFNMKDGFCYLIGSNTGSARTATVVNAGVQIKAATHSDPIHGSTTCSAGFDCPDNDGCLYATNDKKFYAHCNYDYYGGDLAIRGTDNLTACTDICATYAGCVVVTWMNGMCYLKGPNTNLVYNTLVDSAYMMSSG
ncbi:hypothetical protein EJ02DRAFT_431851 [Clathrospora elynae]|uniref:LCCL domain-containing protein n=1 Tax=Clathrospora elynae TaxID=706981 RepID=A0A6A5SXI7_9PLEO|nr:hypothetical protein EJ02DRAFT_431851 [Clathrospora elynae]